jgi:hypothetical protein
MDVGIRQSLLQALARATAPGARIGLRRKDGRLLMIGCDFVCYENHVEATDDAGRLLTISYADIDAVDTSSETAHSPNPI